MKNMKLKFFHLNSIQKMLLNKIGILIQHRQQQIGIFAKRKQKNKSLSNS